MSTEQPDRWDALPHTTPTEQELQDKLDSFPAGDPLVVAMTFLHGLADMNELILETVITPESRTSWGDFRETHDYLERFGDWGVGSETQYLTEHGVEIAYVKVLPDVQENMVVTEETPVMDVGIVSLVHRPDLDGRWYVQGIGGYWHPSAD